MIYILSFLFAGLVCLIGELLLDVFKLKPGVVTSLFVSIGAFLDIFNVYDFFIKKFGAGTMVVITSFGHSLMHSAIKETGEKGALGLLTGMFSLTTCGITCTIIIAFFVALIFKPKN